MKSLMLRSSRAFLGGGGFLGLWATPGDICRHTFVRAAVTCHQCLYNPFKSVSVTGAPGVAPVAGKPGLTMGIMGAPGAPVLHRDRRKGKRDSETQCRPSDGCEGHQKGSLSTSVQ